MSFTPSTYQSQVFEFVRKGRGNGIINAVAGSGKTTTLIKAAEEIPAHSSKLFCAFNRSIKEEIERKFLDSNVNISVKTIHGIGYSCLAYSFRPKQLTVEEYKYQEYLRNDPQLIEELTKELDQIQERRFDLAARTISPVNNRKLSFSELRSYGRTSLIEIINMARLTLTPLETETIKDMVLKYNLTANTTDLSELSSIISYAERVLRKGNEQARQMGIIDYTDMLYLPHILGLRPYQFDYVFIDECQDLSASQLDLVLKSVRFNGRILAVGDPFQSLYGFAGADPESFENVKNRTRATELPLSISYRCANLIVELAQKINPEIQPKPDAPNGNVETISHNSVYSRIRTGDMIICRSNAPLIEMCIHLISQGKSANVKGRDIGEGLSSMAKDISEMDNFRFSQFTEFLEAYTLKRLEKLGDSPQNQNKVQTLIDQYLGLKACFSSFSRLSSIDDLINKINSIFANENPDITLSSIHRAKGLETERVFILEYERMPLTWENQLDWQLFQELCAQYVAVTRAKKELFLVVTNQLDSAQLDSFLERYYSSKN